MKSFLILTTLLVLSVNVSAKEVSTEVKAKGDDKVIVLSCPWYPKCSVEFLK